MVTLTPRDVFRGNPPVDTHQPDPNEVVDLLDRMMSMIAAGVVTYQDDLTGLQAFSGTDGDIGFVVSDGANNGVYEYQSDEWVKTADLPEGFAGLNSIENAKLADMATQTLKGRSAAGTGAPEDLTAAQVKALLALSNVNNTSDSAKPVSAAQKTALDGKSDLLGEDGVLQWPVAWMGPDGRVHGYIDHLARLAAGGFLSLDVGDGTAEDGFAIEPIITGAGGEVRLGWDEQAGAGGLAFEVAKQTAGALIEKAGGTVTLRSGQTAFMAHDVGTMRVGLVAQLGGFMAEVAERRLGASAVAIARAPGPIEICMTMGQSNAGTGGTPGVNPRKLTGAPFQNSVLGFSTVTGTAVFQTASAGSEADTSVLVDFLPWQDFTSGTGNPQNQGGMIAFGLEAAYRARGALGPGIACHVDWHGGQTIATFAKGQPSYENLIAHHVRAVDLAALYGRTVQATAVHYIQGESWSAGYQAALDTLCDNLRSDIQTATGQAGAPVVLLAQINEVGDEGGTVDDVALDQLAVAASRPEEVKISAPMYQGRLTDSDIHLDAESRMMVGAAIGDVHQRLIAGAGWDTLAFSASRAGAVITLTYETNGMDIEFDPGAGQPGDGWVKAVSDYGFEYSDDSSGATISDVAVVPDSGGRLSKIEVTLSTDPGAAANKLLSYARNHAGETADDNWAGARGMIRCRGPRSMFRDMGFAVPEFIWHYAVQQEVAV
ncbi:sialate O-acetylesterase [Phaeobacter sp. 22II1-1F12B]|uniref:sialate O-acetylesterase n=1 Tax=Phaeobacter sp. 22II1-1F12B TaxID=1317111 RepID=UPI000B521F85|nr:sialate O-acetylesterase [Phaeobacter sp. 22II1-1F12B]OWU80427.1 hypothetical protein ATO1_08730 [Phaeobacter sp. 22II1-1F12B]